MDLAFYGHVHDYSRYLPAYKDEVVNEEFSQDLSNYTNPLATVHFTIGGAGNPEMTDSPTGCAYYDGTVNSWHFIALHTYSRSTLCWRVLRTLMILHCCAGVCSGLGALGGCDCGPLRLVY